MTTLSAKFVEMARADRPVFAEFETNLRRERQLEGVAKAKAAGVYKGRPASIDAARVRELKGRASGHRRLRRRSRSVARPCIECWRMPKPSGPDQLAYRYDVSAPIRSAVR
jgi:hypothetical protein